MSDTTGKNKPRLTIESLQALAARHGMIAWKMAQEAGMSVWSMRQLMRKHGMSRGRGKYPRPPIDEKRKRIMQMLVAGSMSAAEAAAELKITTQAVYAAKKKWMSRTHEGKESSDG
jgi:DNA-binding CsgD family transcriptional regulator